MPRRRRLRAKASDSGPHGPNSTTLAIRVDAIAVREPYFGVYPCQTHSSACGSVCCLTMRSVWPALRTKTNW